jgi:FKBP-type peptidyl-prolyl cis-trans isomerase 2
MAGNLEPGMLVRHPGQGDWGLGQVQSVAGSRVTVNFEHAGKVVIDSTRIDLVPEFGTSRP